MKKIITSIILLTIINIANISVAIENLTLNTENENVNINESFKIYVNIGEIKTASYTLNIYFDNSKVEYLSGSENTNVVNNRIINIWYDKNGGEKTKSNEQIAVFEFKAKEIGTTSFYLNGEFFDSKGNSINVNNSYLKINIIEEQNNKKINEIEGEDNNSLLKIMRLDKEGLIPEFSPNIKEYYFITDLNTNSLDVTAIPQATNADINITGNKNLKEGLNKILIQVTSKNNSNKSTYTINVTKTNDEKAANTNLEMLAIENVTLEPIFDTNILNYDASVSNDTKNLNIFAVSENINGKVEITGKDKLVEGNNIVIVKVTAPNGYSYKNYIINVYKRSTEEDKKLEEEKKENTEKLNTILSEQGTKLDKSYKKEEKQNTEEKDNKKIIIIGLIIIIGIEIFIIIEIKNKKRIIKISK